MNREPQSFADMLAEEEERRLAETRREIAAEEAARAALTPEQRAAADAAREARWEALANACDAHSDDSDDVCDMCDEPGCDGDCDGEYD